MTDTATVCPSCHQGHAPLEEFCPHCKVRLAYLVRPAAQPLAERPVQDQGYRKSDLARTNAQELEATANVCARLAGFSLLWPVLALTMALIQGQSAKSLIALMLAVVPALAGLVCFFAASTYLRAEARKSSGSSNLVSGVLFALAGAAVWYYSFQFFMDSHY